MNSTPNKFGSENCRIFFIFLDAHLSQNTWKVHEGFSLMLEDLEREDPHPGRRRHQDPWITQRAPSHSERNSEQQISVANGIFFQNGYSIRPDYRNAMESAYKSTLQRLDFANKPELSTQYINKFVYICSTLKVKCLNIPFFFATLDGLVIKRKERSMICSKIPCHHPQKQ